MELTVKDMTCGRCAQHVTAAIKALDAAAQISIDVGAHRVSVNTSAAPDAVMAAIEQAGYHPESPESGAA